MTLDFIRFEVLVIFWNCDLEKELKKLAKRDVEASKKLRSLLQDHSEYLDKDEALNYLSKDERKKVSFVDGDLKIREAYSIIQTFHPEYFKDVSLSCLFYSEDSDNNYDGLFGSAEFNPPDEDEGDIELPENIEDVFGFEYMEENHGNDYIEYCAEWLIGWVNGEQILYGELKEYKDHKEETKEWFKKKYEEDKEYKELFSDDVDGEEDYASVYNWRSGSDDISKGWGLFLSEFPQAKKDMLLYIWFLEDA